MGIYSFIMGFVFAQMLDLLSFGLKLRKETIRLQKENEENEKRKERR